MQTGKNKFYAYLIKIDGTVIPINEYPTLEMMQKYVGELIEYLPINSNFNFIGNEEAKLLGLKRNEKLIKYFGNILVVNEIENGVFEKFNFVI